MASRLCILALLFLGGACELIPQRLTDCSASRPCPGGQLCDPETSQCIVGPLAVMSPGMDPGLSPLLPECSAGCMPCQLHSECPSQVCDTYLSSSVGGTCVPAEDVLYVDNRGGACSASGDGSTPASALCTMAEALVRIDGIHKRVIRMMPSSKDYGSLVIVDQSVAIFGPAGQGGSAQFQGSPMADAVVITGTSQVVINGTDISKGKVGLLCHGTGSTSLMLRRSTISGNSDLGLSISDCGVMMDRIVVRDNGNGALSITGSQNYVITNSFIVRNHSMALPAIALSSTGNGTFLFNTVADNSSTFAGAIQCLNSGVVIGDSIVFRNSRLYGTQLQNCGLRDTAVGMTDYSSGIRQDPAFTQVGNLDYALDSRMNNSCCIDRASDTVREDFFGNPRPRGRACDLGAHEAR